MGRRPQRECQKKKELNVTTKSLMKNVSKKPPTKAVIRSVKPGSQSKRKQSEGALEGVLKNKKTASHSAVELNELLTVSSESARVNTKSVVETKREKIREQKDREAKDDDSMKMDPEKILKDPKKYVATTYNAGLPLEGFEKKVCTADTCAYPVRRYILGLAKDKDRPKDVDGNVIPDEPGFISFITTEMCCNPAACKVPTELKVSKLPQNLYRKQLTMCDEKLLLTDAEMNLIAARKANPSIDKNPIPNQDIVMRLVRSYVEAGKPKFQMKEMPTFESEKCLVELMEKYDKKS